MNLPMAGHYDSPVFPFRENLYFERGSPGASIRYLSMVSSGNGNNLNRGIPIGHYCKLVSWAYLYHVKSISVSGSIRMAIRKNGSIIASETFAWSFSSPTATVRGLPISDPPYLEKGDIIQASAEQILLAGNVSPWLVVATLEKTNARLFR